jgi:hypothetical protein
MKKLMLLAGLYCLQPNLHAATYRSSAGYEYSPVNAAARARANFKENYAWVKDASWYDASDNSMYCIFYQGTMVNRIFYDRNGNWQYTLVSYPGSVLSKTIRETVLDNFAGYRITYVNEVRTDGQETVYMINLEDENSIKVVQVTGDDILVKQALTKG